MDDKSHLLSNRIKQRPLAFLVIVGTIILFFEAIPQLVRYKTTLNQSTFNQTKSNELILTPPVVTQTTPVLYETYPELTFIQPNYQGYSIRELYDELDYMSPPKGKYQSSKEHEAEKVRKRAEKSSLLNGYIILKEGMSFLLDYNADEEQFHLDLPRSVAESRIINGGRHLGSTAFGVNAIIQKEWKTIYYFEFKNIKNNSLSFKLPAQKARELDNLLTILYIAKLKAPYIIKSSFENEEYHEPTLDDPVERRVNRESVVGELAGVAIYNQKTGEVIYTENLGSIHQ